MVYKLIEESNKKLKKKKAFTEDKRTIKNLY